MKSIAINWENLSKGSEAQKNAYEVIQRSQVMKKLKDHSPVLIGTYPLDIQIDNSDLDIACCASNLKDFERWLVKNLGSMRDFNFKTRIIQKTKSLITSFTFDEMKFEIFSQTRPVQEQYGFRHLLIEEILLAIGGESAKTAIIKLKQSGLKTEPAFAEFFGIEGDPYEMLYELSFLTPKEIRLRI